MNQPIEIVEISTTQEAEAMAKFFHSVWADGDDVVPFDLILAAIHVGGYATLAKQNGEIIAASFGFMGTFAAHPVLHSHVTASKVSGGGLALKQHQYDWAKQRGIAGITWTFDPLVRRNCVFNFEKLGAFAVEYLPNFYGTMTDSINAGDDSDRLMAYWPIAELVEVAPAQTDAVALKNVAGAPQIASVDHEEAFWVELPADIESLRQSNLPLAKQWRTAVREVLQPKLDAGWFIHVVNQDRTAILLEPASTEYTIEDEE